MTHWRFGRIALTIGCCAVAAGGCLLASGRLASAAEPQSATVTGTLAHVCTSVSQRYNISIVATPAFGIPAATVQVGQGAGQAVHNICMAFDCSSSQPAADTYSLQPVFKTQRTYPYITPAEMAHACTTVVHLVPADRWSDQATGLTYYMRKLEDSLSDGQIADLKRGAHIRCTALTPLQRNLIQQAAYADGGGGISTVWADLEMRLSVLNKSWVSLDRFGNGAAEYVEIHLAGIKGSESTYGLGRAGVRP